jgi:hypothetical protein
MRENRKHCRIPYDARMQVSWVTAGPGGSQAWSTQAQCVDLSPAGIRFEMDEPVAVGTAVRMLNSEIDFMGSGTVRHVQLLGTGRYSVGLELSPETSADIFNGDPA